jgi:antitoxin MazE
MIAQSGAARNDVDSAGDQVYLHCVQKWGNSLALRIPKSFAEEAGLHEDATVDLSLVEGRLVVRTVLPQPLTLKELLRGITDENLPGEWDTGPAAGKEIW